MTTAYCAGCGRELPDPRQSCQHCYPDVSDPDAKLDDMVEKAAIPSLATLFRKAKDQGAIKPVVAYGGPTST